jgi:signal transduction histidine kinase
MRLSEFLRLHAEQILLAWDEFAATVSHGGVSMDQAGLRDHAAQILKEIADDLDEPQSPAEQIAKSRGEEEKPSGAPDTAAETHADTRIVAGFGIDAMLTEYRALRASVLRMWAETRADGAAGDELQQLTRFNEAIDQAITESVARYTEQVERSTNLFMGMLGHDIRNPLGTIRLSAELLTRSGQVSHKAAEPIVNAAKRIQGIVELIVDFSRAQSAGTMPIELVPGHIGAIVADVLAETRIRHPGTNFMLHADTTDTHGDWDEGRIGQLLSNLLENAVLYGARDAPVTVFLGSDQDHVSLGVNNTGKIIPLDDRERIFEPRHRGIGDEEQRTSSGLGLGLYICREIVRAHNGTLSVRSNEAEGTTFTARLPRQQAGHLPAAPEPAA